MLVELSDREIILITDILDETIQPVGSEFEDEIDDLYTRLCQNYLPQGTK